MLSPSLFLLAASFLAMVLADIVDDWILAMSLDEKISLLSGSAKVQGYTGFIPGIPRLKIPSIRMNDGPQGFRGPKATSTAFPCGLSLAATFWPELVFKVAQATGQEFIDKGANVFLGPGMNLARIPTCGRNFEYLCGEDPLLGEIMATEYIKGIQSHDGLIATAKHYANNDQETNRNSVNANVQEETEWNLYYRPFLASVQRANVGSLMCAYNSVNGQFACENEKLLNRDLKLTMNFQGFVMSDWFATRSTRSSAVNGLDVEMPISLYFGKPLKSQILSGDIPISLIDAKLKRLLTTLVKAKVDYNTPFNPQKNVTNDKQAELARFAVASSVVLLKNEGRLLPLKPTSTLVLVGDGAKTRVISTGGGSGHVIPAYVTSPFEAISQLAQSVVFVASNDVLAKQKTIAQADVVLVFVGTSSTEGVDRKSLGLDANQLRMVDMVISLNEHVGVCVTGPGAVLLPFFSAVKSVVMQFMPGQAAGGGLADVLFGRVDPGGARLPLTFPQRDNEMNMSKEQYPGANYSEGIDIGYRFYARHDAIHPLLPFGFGLSFAKFNFLGMHMRRTKERLDFQFGLINTAWKRAGLIVPQLYVTRFPSEAGNVKIALVGFQRCDLKPFEVKSGRIEVSLSVELNRLSPLAVWANGAYRVYPGKYIFSIGTSSSHYWNSVEVHI